MQRYKIIKNIMKILSILLFISTNCFSQNKIQVGLQPNTQFLGVGTNLPNSTLQVFGSVSFAYRAVNSATTLTANDYSIEATGGTFTITAPTAIGITGRPYEISNTGTGVITITSTSGQAFNGATTITLNSGHGVTIRSNGSNYIIANLY